MIICPIRRDIAAAVDVVAMRATAGALPAMTAVASTELRLLG